MKEGRVSNFKTDSTLVLQNGNDNDIKEAFVVGRKPLSRHEENFYNRTENTESSGLKPLLKKMIIGRKCDSNYRSFVRDFENATDIVRMSSCVAV